MQQNDQRPIAGLDVMQPHVADLCVALPKFGPVVRHQAGERVGGEAHGVQPATFRLLLPMRLGTP
jgi:hypothetical protein